MYPLIRAGLMGLGKLPGFLGRGTGWRKGAKGVEEVVRAAQPQHTLRHTPIRPLKEPVVNPYNPALVRRWGRTSKDQFRGVPGVTTGGTRAAPTITYRRTPAVTRDLPAGYLRRKPVRSAAYGALGLGTAGGTAYGLMAGEDPAVQAMGVAPVTEPWAAPEDIMGFAEAEAARAERGEKNIQDMLTKGFLIAAAGGDPSKFFDRGLEVLKTSEQYKTDKDYAKVVRAVYKKGDMPKNARDAYERLAPLVGPEKAAILSGHQLGMEEGKTQQERLWNKIIDIAGYDMESAVAELVAAWGTGRFKPAPVQTNIQVREKKARQMLEGVVAGGAGYAEGVTSIRPGIAASA